MWLELVITLLLWGDVVRTCHYPVAMECCVMWLELVITLLLWGAV